MIQNVPMNQLIRQFDESHGDDGIQIHGWMLFGDGAKREMAPYGAMEEPDEDPYERWKTQVLHRELHVRRAESLFNELYEDISTDPYAYTFGPENVKKLKAARSEVQKQRKLLAKLRASNPRGPEVERVDTAAAGSSRKRDTFKAEIRGIRI